MKISRTCQFTPLKIRGVRPARRTSSLAGGGVMRMMEVTPFFPLTLRGRFEERVLTLRGRFKEMGEG